MLNLIGTTPPVPAILAVDSAHLHLYGKSPRAGRKLGHITLRGDDEATLKRPFDELARLVDGA
jgi:5-(carboxyamino)imidazole ribonucleotide synthase